jgi:hypothetical protein
MTVTRVADEEDLLETVADVRDRDAAGLELADDRKQGVDLALRERGGRLVEDQDLGVEGQRLGDLDHLLFGHAELGDLLVEIQVALEQLQDLRRARPLGGVVDDLEGAGLPARLMADEHILQNRHLLEQAGLLIHDGDAAVVGLVRIAERDLLAV